MKFLGMVLGCVLIGSVAQAGFLTSVLNSAIQISESRRSHPEPTTLGGAFLAGGSAATAKYYANELLDSAAMLSVLAMSANGGEGQDMGYAESGLTEKLPCQSDLYATKDGVATLTLGNTCPPRDEKDVGFTVSPLDVLKAIETVGGSKVYCEQNICQIDFDGKK